MNVALPGRNSALLCNTVYSNLAGAFKIRDRRTGQAGIPQYHGWAVADFEAAIRALVTHPELGGGTVPH